MRLSQFASWFAQQQQTVELMSRLGHGTVWSSMATEARPFFVSALWHHQPNEFKALIVTSSYEKILQWQAKLNLYGIPAEKIRLLPSGLSSLFEDSAPESVALSDRIGALRSLAMSESGIVIATAPAALERTLTAEHLAESFISIQKGQTVKIQSLLNSFKRFGYESSDPIRVPGQFSLRGGILDVFPMGHEVPIRIEFFDDEIESLRKFDTHSQRSIGQIESLEITTTRETLLPGPEAQEMFDLLERSCQLESASLAEDSAQNLEEHVAADLRCLRESVYFNRLDLYRPLLMPDLGGAADLLGNQGWLVLDDPYDLEISAKRSEEELAEALTHRIERGEMLHGTLHDYVLSVEQFGQAERVLALTHDSCPSWVPRVNSENINAQSLAGFRAQPTLLAQAIRGWKEEDFVIGLATDQPSRAKSMLSQIEIFVNDLSQSLEPGITMLEGNSAGGFALPDQKLSLITDQEIFGVARLKLAQRKFSEGSPVTNILDLKPGDYVVHINFGIGVFQGLVKRLQEGIEKEYLHIEYQAPDRLFVPIDQLDRIQKFLAHDDAPPKVNRLTGSEWKKTVSRAREDAREYARELISLYAERKRVQRSGYGPDSPWQAEMEHTFPWVETPSQMTAICDVKEDLAADYPMDRLICGDVGFGKTEVAIRAAFKVAQAGKQVAVLCPTTILSEQHFRNFQERLAGFPTQIELINRFRTTAERSLIKRKLKHGEIDILVGTHALLSDDLQFCDLGLLIIDEEQKFGVKHKEALKSLRVNVDVLTLSATPIPRTLSMALMHIRQMSLITDPPPGRLPIRTFVRPFSSEVIREALLRELARGGQVYYVYNRVDSIYHVAEKIRKLVPNARVAVGHGQMSEKEIEPVMVGFIKGEIDILVSTTIVENGLDIPNANTLVIENADRFGLSQLYQLRGRVGRSDRQAYAYFLYSGSKTLTENAQNRLQALQDFSHLGSGYSVAFRDLQIRGAGNLLGAKQSGQIQAVGFDLYTQLIESEIGFLKTFADGQTPSRMVDPLAGLESLPSVEIPVTAHIPAEYVPNESQRLFYYKEMMSTRDPKTLVSLSSEIEDRFGRLPLEVKAAFGIMHLRLQCPEFGISKIEGKGGRLVVTFSEDTTMSPRVFSVLTKKYPKSYMSQDLLIWPITGDPILACRELFKGLKESAQDVEDQRASLGLSR